MNKPHSADIVQQPRRTADWEPTTGSDSDPLEVNVIFTGPQATAAALKSAESMARDLGARIRLRAAIAVPLRLPLDQSPVSVPFMEQLLADLVGQPDPDRPERTGELYVCRNRVEALLRVLKPNSLVVIGGRKRWWPTPASRMAGAIRAKGHRVVFVDAKVSSLGQVVKPVVAR